MSEPSSPPPSRRGAGADEEKEKKKKKKAEEQQLPAFEAWRADPTPLPAVLLSRDRERATAFAVEFLNWLRDESAPLLTLKPGAAGGVGGPASTTTPRFHQYLGPAPPSGASLRGPSDAGRIRTSSLRRRPPVPVGSPQATAVTTGATAGLNPEPRHLFTEADFPALGGGGGAAAAGGATAKAEEEGPSSPNPLLEGGDGGGDGSTRGTGGITSSTAGGLGSPLACRRGSSDDLMASAAPSSGMSTPVHQQQQQLQKKAKRRIRPTIISGSGGGGATSGIGALEPSLSAGMSGGIGDGDLTRLPNAPPILLPPPRGSSLPVSALRPPTGEAAATDGAGAASSSSASFLTPVKRSSSVGAAPRPSAGAMDGSGAGCLARPRAAPTITVMRSPLPVAAPSSAAAASDRGEGGDDSPLTVVTTTRLPEELRERLGVMAGVYATILALRLAPKLATELHLLARLLTVDESLVRITDFPPAAQPAGSLLSPPSAGTDGAAGPFASPSPVPASTLLLESGLACNHLAARTLEGIRPILLHLSPPLLSLFAAAAALRREAEALADEVQQRASEAQARLRFQDTGALLHAGGGRGRGGESGGGDSLLLLTAESAALPFVEERDARHLYQGAAWSNELFNRQEEARDAFLKLLRDFQEEKGQLDGRRVAAFLQALPTRAQDVLALLFPFSIPWFAELFAATLLRVGLGAAPEADDDILSSRGTTQQLRAAGGSRSAKADGGGRGKGGGNQASSSASMSILPSSKKVQLLQDRLRSRGGPTQRASLGASSKRLAPRAAATGPMNSSRSGGGRGGGGAGAGAGAAGAAAGAGSHPPSPEIYFPGNQEFFFHFLRACDSYTLNLALARVLGAELARTALSPSAAATANSGGKAQRPSSEHGEEEDADTGGAQQLTDPMHLARLKLLARFLGLLIFSPNWSNALPQLALLDAKHPLRVALRDRTRAADRGTVPLFPCLELLRTGWATGRAVLVLPWIAEYLRMMRWDPISARTRYYQEVIAALRAVYWRLVAQEDADARESPRAAEPKEGAADAHEDGRVANALFLSFELEQLFEDLAVERAAPPAAGSPLLEEFPPFGEAWAGARSSNTSSQSSSAVLDGEPLPLTERFLPLCSRPMNELAYLLRTALAAYQAAKAEGAWGGPGGCTPMKKVRPYRIGAPSAASASSLVASGAVAAAPVPFSTAAPAIGPSSSVLFSPGAASLRKIKPRVVSSQPQQGPTAGSAGPGALGSGSGSGAGAGGGSLAGLMSRLEAAFFQQHLHLHRCTELALQATLKNGLALARERCVAPAVQAALGRLLQGPSPQLQSLDPAALVRVLDEAQRQAAAETRDFLRPFFEQRLAACLRALAEPSSPAAVTDVAVRMAVQHALAHGIEPVVEDVCLAVKRQVEAQRQAALKERAWPLPAPAAAEGKKNKAATGALSPLVTTQQAIRHLRAALEGAPLLAAEDLRQLVAQAHGHLKSFLLKGAPDGNQEQAQEAVDLAATMHAFLGFALQAAATPLPSQPPTRGPEGPEDGEEEQQQQLLLQIRSRWAARGALHELVRAMPPFWSRLRELEGEGAHGGGDDDVHDLVVAFCHAHFPRLLLALLRWGDCGPANDATGSGIPETEAKQGVGPGGGVIVAADWWLGLVAAGLLTPVQVETMWLRSPAPGPHAPIHAVAARLVQTYHERGAGKDETGYHPLHFSRLRALVPSQVDGRLDE